MMKMKMYVSGVVLAVLMPSALACSQLPAFGVFVAQNDANRDGKLSRREFLKARFDANLVAKFKLNSRSFRQLDANHNGQLERDEQEWYNWIEYKRAPCADWEEQMQKMQSQNPNAPRLAQ